MVELALILPLLLMLTFGIVEYGWMFYCSAQINLAARGGVRAAVRPAAIDSEVRAEVAQIMNQTGWQEDIHYSVTIVDMTAPVGNPVKVSVSVPYDYVGFRLPFLPVPDAVGGTATMAKEGPP